MSLEDFAFDVALLGRGAYGGDEQDDGEGLLGASHLGESFESQLLSSACLSVVLFTLFCAVVVTWATATRIDEFE